MQAFAGFGQAFPYVAFHLPQQKQFADCAGAFLVPNETRRQHLGIVDDQQVPGLQKACLLYTSGIMQHAAPKFIHCFAAAAKTAFKIERCV